MQKKSYAFSPTNRAFTYLMPYSSDWAANTDSACRSCRSIYSLSNRRHHCRGCGKIFCGGCSRWKVFYTDKKVERTCLNCVVSFEARNIDESVKDELFAIASKAYSTHATSDQGLSRKKFADAAMDATKLSAEELRNLDMKPIELSVTQGDPLSSQEFFEKLLPVMIEKVYKQAILMEQRDKDRLQASCDVTIDAMMRNSVYENSSHTLKLFQACAAGDYQEVVRALDNGANLKHKLDLSLTNSSMENCEWLWLNYIDCKDGTTPLHFSMFHGYGDISSYLIKKGANCNRKNEDGKAPIDVARSRGHWEILQGLGLHSPSKTKK